MEIHGLSTREILYEFSGDNYSVRIRSYCRLRLRLVGEKFVVFELLRVFLVDTAGFG